MRIFVAALTLTATAANAQLSGAPENPARDTLALAKRFYFENNMGEALPLFRMAARSSPKSAELHVWLAEAARRSGAIDEARREARLALALDRCNARAHHVLANALNPQYATDTAANQDSSWIHLGRAIQCDSTEGNAWLSVVFEAARMGDMLLVSRALRELVNTRFLTPVHITNARWILSLLPPRAILVTAGDMDTYPVLAAQEAFGLRPDVAVLNESMLNLNWYGAYAFKRYNLRTPRTPYDTSKSQSKNILHALRASAAAGSLGRPLVLSNTFGQDFPHIGPGFAKFAGPYWLVSGDSSLSVDTILVHRAMNAADGLEWSGAAIAPQDLSPVRRTSWHPTILMAYHAITAGEMLRGRNAAYWSDQVGWAKAFLMRAGFDETAIEKQIAEIQSWITK